MIAGPSEVVVVSDGSADPRWLAADLMAQAEHDEQAQAILLSPDLEHINAVADALVAQLEELPRAKIIRESLATNGALIQTDDLGQAAELVDRLAPEHPYPAGADDCEAAALWLFRNAGEHFGTELVAIGGESAGAHLAAVTCLRLRDRHGLSPFRAALLTYGAYDLRGTPSVREAGEGTLILTTKVIRWFAEQFVGSQDLSDPDISPILADLHGMPPALFTVGSIDPLYDDSVFMFNRWRTAGNRAELAVWPEGIHAFDYFDNDYGRAARDRMHGFLNRTIG